MLVLFTVIGIVLGIAGFAVFIRWLTRPNYLEEHSPKNLAEPAFHSLFEPTEEEIRAAAKEDSERLKARQNELLTNAREEKLAKLADLRQTWASSPDKRNTVELFLLASESESGEAFAEIAECVVESWRAGAIDSLSADDLAHIMESHFWLLPVEERTAGVSFRVNREVAELRKNHPSANADTPPL